MLSCVFPPRLDGHFIFLHMLPWLIRCTVCSIRWNEFRGQARLTLHTLHLNVVLCRTHFNNVSYTFNNVSYVYFLYSNLPNITNTNKINKAVILKTNVFASFKNKSINSNINHASYVCSRNSLYVFSSIEPEINMSSNSFASRGRSVSVSCDHAQ